MVGIPTATTRLSRRGRVGALMRCILPVITREIELGKTGDEFTATTTFENFDANDQLFNTGCATSTAMRFE